MSDAWPLIGLIKEKFLIHGLNDLRIISIVVEMYMKDFGSINVKNGSLSL
jgi:hypothetical protein